MVSRGEAVAENASHHQKLVFFSTSLWRDLQTQISAVRCASYIAVATIRTELLKDKVLDKKKKQFAIMLLAGFIP